MGDLVSGIPRSRPLRAPLVPLRRRVWSTAGPGVLFCASEPPIKCRLLPRRRPWTHSACLPPSLRASSPGHAQSADKPRRHMTSHGPRMPSCLCLAFVQMHNSCSYSLQNELQSIQRRRGGGRAWASTTEGRCAGNLHRAIFGGHRVIGASERRSRLRVSLVARRHRARSSAVRGGSESEKSFRSTVRGELEEYSPRQVQDQSPRRA